LYVVDAFRTLLPRNERQTVMAKVISQQYAVTI
jgi:hypothetical protein